MEIGKVKIVRTNVPGATPVVIPKPKPKERPIYVPNWPRKQPVSVPAKTAGK